MLKVFGLRLCNRKAVSCSFLCFYSEIKQDRGFKQTFMRPAKKAQCLTFDFDFTNGFNHTLRNCLSLLTVRVCSLVPFKYCLVKELSALAVFFLIQSNTRSFKCKAGMKKKRNHKDTVKNMKFPFTYFFRFSWEGEDVSHSQNCGSFKNVSHTAILTDHSVSFQASREAGYILLKDELCLNSLADFKAWTSYVLLFFHVRDIHRFVYGKKKNQAFVSDVQEKTTVFLSFWFWFSAEMQLCGVLRVS